MLPMDIIFTFFMAATVLALVPGPDNIFVLTQSTLYGKISGIIVVFGLATGLIFHTTAVAFGVAVIFQTSPIAFTILKFIGVSYLLYLAWQAYKSNAQSINNKEEEITSYKKLYIRGIIMNITNPKVSIFFLAFLPQFADPARGLVSIQILFLGLIFIISTILVFGAIAILGGTLGKILNKSDNIQVILNKIASFVFIILAIKLLTTSL